MTNILYDLLKWLSMVGLPSLGWLLGQLGHTDIGGTVAVIGVFVGMLVGVSGIQYQKSHQPTPDNQPTLPIEEK